MKLAKFLALLLVLSLPLNLLGQVTKSINGKIVDEDQQPLSNVSVLVKSALEEIITYSLTDLKGRYNLILPSDTDMNNIKLSIQLLGFKKASYPVIITTGEKVEMPVMVLVEDFNELQEVQVTATDRGIRIRNDTTVYKAEKFADGTESKIQDLLKKMPGIEVQEDGRLKFKGREVSKLLIENDDLFNNNYSIGTKNISANIIDEVQAIERYSENPLLKGLENTDKIALNLKLKDNEFDFSVNSTLGVGHESRLYADIVALGISKKYKSLSIAHYNNSGINTSPYDYSISTALEKAVLKPSLEHLLRKGINLSNVDSEYTVRNRNSWLNTNTILKLTHRTNLTINVNKFDDLLKTRNRTREAYFSTNDSILFDQINSIRNKPNVFNADFKLSTDLNNRTTFNFESKNRFEKNNANFEYSFNSLEGNRIESGQKDAISVQELEYIHKIKANSAIQFLGRFNYGSLNENDTYINERIFLGDLFFNNQQVVQKTFGSNVLFNYLKSNDKSKLSHGLELNYQNSKFSSGLGSVFNPNQPQVSNANSREYNFIAYNIDYGVTFNKLIINARSKARLAKLQLNGEHNERVSLNFLSSLKYRATSKIDIESFYKYEENPILINQTYQQPVFNNVYVANIFLSDEPVFLKTQEMGLKFRYYDLLKALGINSSISYGTDFNPFVSNSIFDEDIIIDNKEIIDDNRHHRFKINFLGEKLFYDISSKIQLGFNYYHYKYQNRINQSILRNNELSNYNLKFNYQSTFSGGINFSNYLIYGKVQSKNSQNTFDNGFIDNTFMLSLKPNKTLRARFDAKLYVPDMDNLEENLFLLSAMIDFRPVEKNYKFSLSLNNLTNEQKFERIAVTDFSRSIYSQDILSFNVLLKCSFDIL
ncbi:carboxypeptidase-like regulatory domain-containing protein [Maribacter sp. 2210JD10-5]|uniref:TonB-dependent receptor n=1 Tax=Maribacter sp. 2210JD10-5 TaxID=3386272 RepID=UPI0039BC765A